jgi:MoxR-like ATPase
MARHPGADAVYECADRFRQRCLVEGRSLLWPERAAWTAENLSIFDEAYLGHPDEGPGTFQKKWQRQLANVPDDVICIAADIMAFYCLMPKSSSIGPKAKTALVLDIAGWRPGVLEIADAQIHLLQGAFADGIAKVGTFYNTGRFGETEFLLTFFKTIIDETIDPYDLTSCKNLAHSVRDKLGVRSQSSIIVLHLLFPNEIEGTTSHSHREKIVKAFSHLVEPVADQDEMILAIRNKLSNDGLDTTFTFHRPDIRAQWDSTFESGDAASLPRIVKITPGQGGSAWNECLAGSYICVGWDKIGDLRQFASKEAFVTAFRDAFKIDYKGSTSQLNEKADELWTLMELKPGDRMVAAVTNDRVLAIGEVTAPGYTWMPERSAARHTVSVNWDTSYAKTIDPQSVWTLKTVAPVPADLWKRIAELKKIEPDPEPEPDPPLRIVSYVEPTFLEILERIAAIGLRIDERTLRRYHLALKTRGFVVLSGLSGTGKTWLADAYAKAVGAQRLIVSVAPNWTTNEDLLGYASPLTERYHDTAFSRFLRGASAEYARASSAGVTATPYHLILDEMNLARVEYYFAKFLSAMEVRMRDVRAEMELGPNDIVTLTPNLFVIGTVNIDETTHGFADKVYDRAQLIELEAHRDDIVAHLGDAVYAEELLLVWDYVRISGPFTFRVLDEIGHYIAHANELEVPWQESLDEQLLQKVLPKLKGADLGVGASLSELVKWSQDRYPLTHARAVLMLKRLNEHGFTSYH